MTIITTEQAQKLLDEATPGPWRSDDAAVRLDDKSLIALVYGNGRGSFMSNNRLFAAAPDLARTVIALHAQLADAKAAMALVRELREEIASSNKLLTDEARASLDRLERAETAEAERDRLAAANVALEAKVAGLVEAVKPFDAVGGTLFSKNWNMSDIVFDGGPMRSDCLFFEDFLNLRAALATQEAGT